MKKVDTGRMHAAEMRIIRMLCKKMLRNEIPNGLLRDRTGVEDIEYHPEETRLIQRKRFTVHYAII